MVGASTWGRRCPRLSRSHGQGGGSGSGFGSGADAGVSSGSAHVAARAAGRDAPDPLWPGAGSGRARRNAWDGGTGSDKTAVAVDDAMGDDMMDDVADGVAAEAAVDADAAVAADAVALTAAVAAATAVAVAVAAVGTRPTPRLHSCQSSSGEREMASESKWNDWEEE